MDGLAGLVVDALRQEVALSEFFKMESGAQGSMASPLAIRMMETLLPLVLRHRDGIAHEEPEVAVGVGLRMLIAGAQALLARPPIGPDGTALETDALVTELGLCYLRYLGEGVSGSREEPRADPLEGDPFSVWA